MKRRHFDHALPSWADPAATFFVTICTQKRGGNFLCHSEVGATALDAVRFYHQEGKWFCSVALLMPDHVHLLVSMSPEHDLATTQNLEVPG